MLTCDVGITLYRIMFWWKEIMKRLAFVLTLTMIAAGPAIAKSGPEIIAASGIKGGLVVHLGCGDGKLTAELRIGDGYLVHGLDGDAWNIRKAREHISQLGLYGVVTVDRWTGAELPYIDNLVNLLVVSDGVDVPRKEVMRVLAPGGVVTAKRDGRWTTATKPRPKATDEWTHYLHGPDNNAVSNDTVVSHPYHMQWVGLPKWTRNHNYLNSYSAVVSSAGRIFSIVDEAPTHSVYYPARWSLVARDAYNGIVIWKKPIGPWEGHLRRFRSGPTELPRRLVAEGERVYVTLGYGKPVSALDAASVVLFLVDAREGMVPLDRLAAERLRRIDKPIILVANKIDQVNLISEIGAGCSTGRSKLESPAFTVRVAGGHR